MRQVRLATVLGAGFLALALAAGGSDRPLVAGASVSPGALADPWWQPLGLRGQAVSAVAVTRDEVAAIADGRVVVSTDGGVRFAAGTSLPPATVPCLGGVTGVPPHPDAVACAGDDAWVLSRGEVLHGQRNGRLTPDAGAPDLGLGARLVAAPAALPGVVVAVAGDGTVWRRQGAGRWAHALLLLPQSLVAGAPAVTAVAAFSRPLSAAVYLGTDGYGVLASVNGGADWFRADPGLPGRVLALVADPDHRALYAGTTDGLWRHHLSALPRPPSYPAPDLRWRWVATAAVTLVAWAEGVVALRWWGRRRAGAGLPRGG